VLSGPVIAAFCGTPGTSTGPSHLLVWVQPPGPAQASALHVAGLAVDRPRLGLSAHNTTGAPPLESIALTLPNGLHFTADRRALVRGVHIAGAQTLTLRHGALVVALRTSRPEIGITVSAPALLETPRLLLIAPHDRAHRRSPRLRIRVDVTDAAGDRTSIRRSYGYGPTH
jgi:hypothetical protein